MLSLAILTTACEQIVPPTVAAVTLAPAVASLEPGAESATVVFVEPAKRAKPKPPDPPKPEPPKPEPPKPEPPKPTGPSPQLVAAENELAALRADSSAVAEAEARERQAEAELRAAGGAMHAELSAAERRVQELAIGSALEEQQVRENKCCSVCGNSKTEIERRGEKFENHLTNVKGTIAQCKGDKLAQVQAKWAAQMRPAKDKVDELKARIGPAREAAQRKLDEAKAATARAKQEREAKVRAAEDKVDKLRRGG